MHRWLQNNYYILVIFIQYENSDLLETPSSPTPKTQQTDLREILLHH